MESASSCFTPGALPARARCWPLADRIPRGLFARERLLRGLDDQPRHAGLRGGRRVLVLDRGVALERDFDAALEPPGIRREVGASSEDGEHAGYRLAAICRRQDHTQVLSLLRAETPGRLGDQVRHACVKVPALAGRATDASN